ncbi:TIGR02679 family protein [Streptomyces sp. NPDC056948]|uniref:TIGR02679 family protein n=1 Tax=Streptomyces sp. NPDC056948 TaxID=3345975 RepID=UPI00363CDCA3
MQVALDEDGARQLGGLLGTVIPPGRTRVRLDTLDTALRASAAQTGLVAAIAYLTGTPLTDQAAARASRQATWEQVWQHLDAALSDAGLASAPWVPGWITGIRSGSLLTRAGSDAAVWALQHAMAALALLPGSAPDTKQSAADGSPPWQLAELAARTTGDAHGLDEGTLAGALTARALAAARGQAPPETPSERRALWENAGVAADLVSGTVLVYAPAPPGDDAWSATMRQRAALGLVTHLTLQELRHPGVAPCRLAEAGQRIYACENPQILQAAAQRQVQAPLVCTSGNPSSAGWELLRRLVADDADLLYHGDFDWPGIAIAARVFAAGVRPWRMSAHDYRTAAARQSAPARLPLQGTVTATPWDPQLSLTMQEHDTAIHEESQLPLLRTDLHERAPRHG